MNYIEHAMTTLLAVDKQSPEYTISFVFNHFLQC